MDFLRRRTSNISPVPYRSPIAMKMSSVAHVGPGAREKALLAKDPALDRFRSYKKSVSRVKRIGEVLTVIIVAECCYEIYVRATMREEARKKASQSA